MVRMHAACAAQVAEVTHAPLSCNVWWPLDPPLTIWQNRACCEGTAAAPDAACPVVVGAPASRACPAPAVAPVAAVDVEARHATHGSHSKSEHAKARQLLLTRTCTHVHTRAHGRTHTARQETMKGSRVNSRCCRVAWRVQCSVSLTAFLLLKGFVESCPVTSPHTGASPHISPAPPGHHHVLSCPACSPPTCPALRCPALRCPALRRLCPPRLQVHAAAASAGGSRQRKMASTTSWGSSPKPPPSSSLSSSLPSPSLPAARIR